MAPTAYSAPSLNREHGEIGFLFKVSCSFWSFWVEFSLVPKLGEGEKGKGTLQEKEKE